jgi:hypothetical protein
MEDAYGKLTYQAERGALVSIQSEYVAVHISNAPFKKA